jgi:O-antigen ligase
MTFLHRAQRYALCFFFFSINFEMWDPFNTGGTFSIAKLTAIIYFITIVPEITEFIRIDGLKSVIFPLWIFFGFLTFMSMININELFSNFFWTPIFLNIAVFWLLINHVRKDYMVIEKAMLWYVLGSVVLVLLYFAGIGVEYVGGRLSMFGDNQNALGVKMTVSLIILLISVTQNRLNIGWYRYFFLFMIPFMVIFIRETGSRVSVISLVSAFLVGTLLYKTKSKFVKIGIVIGSTIVLILIAVLLMQSDILVDRMDSTVTSGNLSSRDQIWNAILPIIKGNPITGIGKTGYDFQFTLIWGKAESPHNVILEILCYTGIIGLFIYLTFLFQVSKIGYQTYNKYGRLLPLLLFIPMMGLLFTGQILEVKIGWIIFAYIVSNSAISYGDYKIPQQFANIE